MSPLALHLGSDSTDNQTFTVRNSCEYVTYVKCHRWRLLLASVFYFSVLHYFGLASYGLSVQSHCGQYPERSRSCNGAPYQSCWWIWTRGYTSTTTAKTVVRNDRYKRQYTLHLKPLIGVSHSQHHPDRSRQWFTAEDRGMGPGKQAE